MEGHSKKREAFFLSLPCLTVGTADFVSQVEEPLSGLSEQGHWLGYSSTAKINSPVTVSSAPFFVPGASPGVWACHFLWVLQDRGGPPGSAQEMLGKLNVCLRFSFLCWRNCRPRGSLLVWCYAGLGKEHCGQSEPAPFTLQMQIFLVCVCVCTHARVYRLQGGSSALPQGSGVFMKVSSLWIVANLYFLEEDQIQGPSISPPCFLQQQKCILGPSLWLPCRDWIWVGS